MLQTEEHIKYADAVIRGLESKNLDFVDRMQILSMAIFFEATRENLPEKTVKNILKAIENLHKLDMQEKRKRQNVS